MFSSHVNPLIILKIRVPNLFLDIQMPIKFLKENKMYGEFDL